MFVHVHATIRLAEVWLRLHRELLTTLTPIASMLVALLALFTSVRTELRAHRRFLLSNRPKLAFDVQFSAERNEVSIVNQGLGLAIIKNVKTLRDGKEYVVKELNRSKSLFELFEFPNGCTWRECKIFRPQDYYLRPGTRFECIVLGFTELVEMFGDKHKAREVFDLYPKQLSRMTLEVKYSDITEQNHFVLSIDFATLG